MTPITEILVILGNLKWDLPRSRSCSNKTRLCRQDETARVHHDRANLSKWQPTK